jgi:hypothetical protein
MPHKFDRHIPEALPDYRMLTRVSAKIPEVVDLREYCGPVKNQGDEGACTAHAGTSAREWISRAKVKGKLYIPGSLPRQFSPQFTYEKELLAQGQFPNDVGSDGTTLCNTLIANGCCELALDPYVPGKIVMPTAEQCKNAAQFTLGAYHGLKGSKVALSVLGNSTPWPVLVGFDVYASLESDEVAETGIYNPKPTVSSMPIGGHEVLCVGYDIGAVPSLRPAKCPPAFLIQNSWGMGWGWNGSGFFWASLAVFDEKDTDLKIAHSGKPWR